MIHSLTPACILIGLSVDRWLCLANLQSFSVCVQPGWILLRLFSSAFSSSLKRLAFHSLALSFFVINNSTITKRTSNPIFSITYQRQQLHILMFWIHLTVSSNVLEKQSVIRLTSRHIETLTIFICVCCCQLTNTEPPKVTLRKAPHSIISARW